MIESFGNNLAIEDIDDEVLPMKKYHIALTRSP